METEDSRSALYITAIWRAVAKACADERMTQEDRIRAVQAAELVEAQLRLTAELYRQP